MNVEPSVVPATESRVTQTTATRCNFLQRNNDWFEKFPNRKICYKEESVLAQYTPQKTRLDFTMNEDAEVKVPETTEVKASEVIAHYAKRNEIMWGRGENIKMISEYIETREPSLSRALLTIADEIIEECEAICGELNTLMAAVHSVTPPDKLQFIAAFGPHHRTPRGWCGTDTRHP